MKSILYALLFLSSAVSTCLAFILQQESIEQVVFIHLGIILLIMPFAIYYRDFSRKVDSEEIKSFYKGSKKDVLLNVVLHPILFATNISPLIYVFARDNDFTMSNSIAISIFASCYIIAIYAFYIKHGRVVLSGQGIDIDGNLYLWSDLIKAEVGTQKSVKLTFRKHSPFSNTVSNLSDKEQFLDDLTLYLNAHNIELTKSNIDKDLLPEIKFPHKDIFWIILFANILLILSNKIIPSFPLWIPAFVFIILIGGAYVLAFKRRQLNIKTGEINHFQLHSQELAGVNWPFMTFLAVTGCGVLLIIRYAFYGSVGGLELTELQFTCSTLTFCWMMIHWLWNLQYTGIEIEENSIRIRNSLVFSSRIKKIEISELGIIQFFGDAANPIIVNLQHVIKQKEFTYALSTFIRKNHIAVNPNTEETESGNSNLAPLENWFQLSSTPTTPKSSNK